MAERTRLPAVRTSLTRHLKITDARGAVHKLYVTIGMYPDGRPGELFIDYDERATGPGSVSALLDQVAIACSIALQHGAPVDTLCGKFIAGRFEPAGTTNAAEHPTCTSPLDLIFRIMRDLYGAR